MTTDVDQALEIIGAAVAGMALLIVLLVAVERLVLRPPAAPAATRRAESAARCPDEGDAPRR